MNRTWFQPTRPGERIAQAACDALAGQAIPLWWGAPGSPERRRIGVATVVEVVAAGDGKGAWWTVEETLTEAPPPGYLDSLPGSALS